MKKGLFSAGMILFMSSTIHAAEQAEQTSTTAPASAPTSTSTPASPAVATNEQTKQNLQKINCDFHFPAEEKNIDQATVFSWAKQAAQQSFRFDYQKLDEQLSQLEKCYTENGWKAFKEALDQSGNLEAIKNEKLDVQSQISGKETLVSAQDNQWKISIPLSVVYKNDKDNLQQHLNVTILVGRKKTGDLGIMQLVATPVPSEQKTGTPAKE